MSANVHTTTNGLNVSFEENTIINWESDDTTITWDNEPIVRNHRQCGMSGYIGLLALIRLRNEIYGAKMEPTLLEKVERIAPFELTTVQRELVNAIQNNDKLIIRKSRQVGMTEIFAMITAINLCENSGKRYLYYAIKQDDARNFTKRVKRYLNKLSYVGNIGHVTERFITSSTYSTLTATSTSTEIIGDYDWVMIDEAAFTNADMSKLGTITDKITVASTLNRLDNTFLPLWLRANKRGYKRFTIKRTDFELKRCFGDHFEYEYGDRLLSHLTLGELESALKFGVTIYLDIADKDDTKKFVDFMLHNHIDFKCTGRNIIIPAQ